MSAGASRLGELGCVTHPPARQSASMALREHALVRTNLGTNPLLQNGEAPILRCRPCHSVCALAWLDDGVFRWARATATPAPPSASSGGTCSCPPGRPRPAGLPARARSPSGIRPTIRSKMTLFTSPRIRDVRLVQGREPGQLQRRLDQHLQRHVDQIGRVVLHFPRSPDRVGSHRSGRLRVKDHPDRSRTSARCDSAVRSAAADEVAWATKRTRSDEHRWCR